MSHWDSYLLPSVVPSKYESVQSPNIHRWTILKFELSAEKQKLIPLKGSCCYICFLHVYVMHKLQIGTIWGLSCSNLGSELCTDNQQIGHILAHALFPVCHVYVIWTMAHCCYRAMDENPFPSGKEGREQILTQESVCIKSMYRNVLFPDRIWLLALSSIE